MFQRQTPCWLQSLLPCCNVGVTDVSYTHLSVAYCSLIQASYWAELGPPQLLSTLAAHKPLTLMLASTLCTFMPPGLCSGCPLYQESLFVLAYAICLSLAPGALILANPGTSFATWCCHWTQMSLRLVHGTLPHRRCEVLLSEAGWSQWPWQMPRTGNSCNLLL